MDDLKDQVISILGGQSFAFSFADTLELHWTLLELCARNRNPEGVTEDPKDQVISISGGSVLRVQFC